MAVRSPATRRLDEVRAAAEPPPPICSEHRQRHARPHARPERDRLGDVEPGADAAARDQVEPEAAHAQQRPRRSGCPSPRTPRPSALRRRVGAQGLDLDPRRAAGARDVDRPDAGVAQPPGDRSARCRSRSPSRRPGPAARARAARRPRARRGSRGRRPAGSAPAPGSDGGRARRRRPPATRRATSAVGVAPAWTTPRLARTSVVGACARTVERVGELGRALHRALRARGRTRCRAPRPPPPASRLMSAASAVPPVMPGDEERRAQALAEERGRDVDLVDRELGQRVVHQVDLLEQRGLAAYSTVPPARTGRDASACGR